jgi:hypothetical protein
VSIKYSVVVAGNELFLSRHFNFLLEFDDIDLNYSESYLLNDVLKYTPNCVLVHDEHWCELGGLVAQLNYLKIPTIQFMDGIIEWRRTWDYARDGMDVNGKVNPLNQPAFSDFLGCLGAKDFRVLSSWGNQRKLQIIGLPRIQNVINIRDNFVFPLFPKKDVKVLIITAKTPGFNTRQMELVQESLIDLKESFETYKSIKPIWRLTAELDKIIGVENNFEWSNYNSTLLELIESADFVISTPSTTILEAMVLKKPVAMLDYNNQPSYIETVWKLTSKRNIIDFLKNDFFNPPLNKLDYQEFLLNDQLNIKYDSRELFKNLILNAINKDTVHSKEIEIETILKFGLNKYYPKLESIYDIPQNEIYLRYASVLNASIEIQKKYALRNKFYKMIKKKLKIIADIFINKHK